MSISELNESNLENKSAFCKYIEYLIDNVKAWTAEQVQSILVWELAKVKNLKLEILLTNNNDNVNLTFMFNNDWTWKIMEADSEICDIPNFEILRNEAKLTEYLNEYYSISEII